MHLAACDHSAYRVVVSHGPATRIHFRNAGFLLHLHFLSMGCCDCLGRSTLSVQSWLLPEVANTLALWPGPRGVAVGGDTAMHMHTSRIISNSFLGWQQHPRGLCSVGWELVFPLVQQAETQAHG